MISQSKGAFRSEKCLSLFEVQKSKEKRGNSYGFNERHYFQPIAAHSHHLPVTLYQSENSLTYSFSFSRYTLICPPYIV